MSLLLRLPSDLHCRIVFGTSWLFLLMQLFLLLPCWHVHLPDRLGGAYRFKVFRLFG